MRGERAVKHSFISRGKRINAIVAISSSGVVCHLTNNNVDMCIFYNFIRAELFPNLQQFDGSSKNSVLIMDNLTVHNCEPIVSILKDMGIVVQFFPPYSPDLNPMQNGLMNENVKSLEDKVAWEKDVWLSLFHDDSNHLGNIEESDLFVVYKCNVEQIDACHLMDLVILALPSSKKGDNRQ